MKKRNSFFDISEERLREVFDKPFRYKQILQWIFEKHVTDFREMSNLPLALREKLFSEFSIIALSEKNVEVSNDKGTKKYLFETEDGLFVETVYMKYEKRVTLCVSTQIGCKMGCKFCATGAQGFTRNLTTGEILSQILYFPDMTNIVFMGMGEPLDNFENFTKVLKLLNDEKYGNIGARRITISTAGIPEKIKALANLGKQFGLSLSLHASTDEKRNQIMPINRNYNIDKLFDALLYYKNKTNADLTLEYILIKDINMTKKDAMNLIALAKKLKAKINFIPYNEHPFAKYKTPTNKEIAIFLSYFEKSGLFYFVRDSRGKDISAACGQLAGTKKEGK